MHEILFNANLLHIIFSYIFCTLSGNNTCLHEPSYTFFEILPDNFLHPTGDARVTMGAGTPLFIRCTLLSAAFNEIARDTTCNRAVMTEQCANIRKKIDRRQTEIRSNDISYVSIVRKSSFSIRIVCHPRQAVSLKRQMHADMTLIRARFIRKKCARARP